MNLIMQTVFETHFSNHKDTRSCQIYGRITEISAQSIDIEGLSGLAQLGDQIKMLMTNGGTVLGEVIKIFPQHITLTAYSDVGRLRIGARAVYLGQQHPHPSEEWIGNILDHSASRIDGLPLTQGGTAIALKAKPPKNRKAVGDRLHTGIAAIDSFLPLCRGQRVGLFAGSGVGKSTLLADLAKSQNTAVDSNVDIVILALIGERGREIREFTQDTLGSEGMKKSIVFAATSDEPAALKLRASWLAMSTAEYFRDQGKHVLLLFDSLTRFAEAHRTVALSAGETPSLRAFPPSTFSALAQLCERAGPGPEHSKAGDITAAFSVLVAGSNMEEPIADMVRGILDGHIILDRTIAERGRFPAVDIVRSVSRSLPECASQTQNQALSHARLLIGAYEKARTLISAGLYQVGGDVVLDEAVQKYTQLDEFIALKHQQSIAQTFAVLTDILSEKDLAIGQE